ncbi:MAG: hypothetical protein HOI53_09970 [Francisellaceae bacterium]|jgi:hypothetical protein|nr:hypothetical protein [Francisellaceae bacterium]MBT6208341.1 hypothetical protein [Francisellaceae bacterium]MBT6539490.1 hypothetical protein [Francisellaceae bacterium]
MPKNTTVLAKATALHAEVAVHIESGITQLNNLKLELNVSRERISRLEESLDSSQDESALVSIEANTTLVIKRNKTINKELESYNKKLSNFYLKAIKAQENISTLLDKEDDIELRNASDLSQEITANIDAHKIYLDHVISHLNDFQIQIESFTTSLTQKQFPNKLKKINVNLLKIHGTIHGAFTAVGALPEIVEREKDNILELRATLLEIDSIVSSSSMMPLLFQHIGSQSNTPDIIVDDVSLNVGNSSTNTITTH